MKLLPELAHFQYCELNFEQGDVESELSQYITMSTAAQLSLLQSILTSSLNVCAFSRQCRRRDTLFATITELTVFSFEGVQGS